MPPYPAETAARQKPVLHAVLPVAGMASNLALSSCGSCTGGSGNTLVPILEINASMIPASAVDAADDTVLGKFIVEHEHGIADLMWGHGVKPLGLLLTRDSSGVRSYGSMTYPNLKAVKKNG